MAPADRAAAPTIRVRDWQRDDDALHFAYEVAGLEFATTLRYHDVDLRALEQRFGAEAMRNVYFHIAAFDVDKLASLGAGAITFGPFADLVTDPFVTLWRTVVHHVWAQWRYEHDRPDWPAPHVLDAARAPAPPISAAPGAHPYLSFCGGGKDSLVAARLLESAEAPYEAFVYASSDYGDTGAQHALIDGLLAHLAPAAVRRLSITEDFLSSDVLDERPELGVRALTAAETPASIFAALPVALAHGHRWLVLGHERSADVGNLTWSANGEEVNHQWGKSTAAEQMLDAHVAQHVAQGIGLFSILKPIHDVVIFGLLADAPAAAVAATHSCNVAKPWCRRCAKCTYVWLGYLAYLDVSLVRAMFGEDLAAVEDPGVQRDLRMMAGLADRTPFECIGEVDEVRLAVDLCRAKGIDGPLFAAVPRLAGAEAAAALARLTTVDQAYPGLPAALRGPVLDRMADAASRTRHQAADLLGAG